MRRSGLAAHESEIHSICSEPGRERGLEERLCELEYFLGCHTSERQNIHTKGISGFFIFLSELYFKNQEDAFRLTYSLTIF